MTVTIGFGVAVLAVAVPLSITTPVRADDAPKPGSETVERVCSVCHGAGLMGAPKIGDGSAWQTRLKTAGSIDALARSAEHGKGNMPPRGGQSALTDEDIKAAIQYMLSKSGPATLAKTS